MSPRARALTVALASGVVALAFSLPRVCRTIALIGDSASLVAAARVWGIAHPPGYPLYSLLGHLVALGPADSVAFRLNVLSAVLHAVAAALAASIVLALTDSAAAGFGAACALAFSQSFLRGSLYAEVFPLNDALVALLFFVAISIHLGRSKSLWALFVVFGLALGHHQMVVLAAPGLALLVAPAVRHAVRERRSRALWLALSMIAAWLSTVALIWFRARAEPVISSGDVHDFGSLVSLLTRSDYGGPLSASRRPTDEPVGERIGVFAIFVWSGFGPIGILAAVVGALGWARSERRPAIAMLLTFVLAGPVFCAINRVSVAVEANRCFFERFVTMSFVPLAVLVGGGLALAERVLTERLQQIGKAASAVALIPALVMLPAALSIDMRHDRAGAALVDDLLRDVPQGALVLIAGDTYTSALDYACAVERRCVGRAIVAPGQLFVPWKRSQLRRRQPDLFLPEGVITSARSHEIVRAEIERRPVYVLPSLLARDTKLTMSYSFVPERLLLRVHFDAAAAQRERERFLALARDLADGKNCSGCALDPRSISRPSQHVQIIDAYAVAFRNAASAARVFGGPSESDRLVVRARLFELAAEHPWTTGPRR